MSEYGFKISKEGYDVGSAAAKDLIMSTEYDMFKILKTGTLTIALPETTKGDGGATDTYTATYSHGLGYTPLFIPDVQNVLSDVVEDIGGTTDDIIINDMANDAFITASGPPTTAEIATLHANTTQVVLTVTRVWDYGGTFLAHNVICYYTIFYNKMSETFDLLD